MSGPLNTQVDIGNLSLASLGLFSTMLTALSADDVQPIAMIQMQNLGAAFPVSGPIPTKAPDYLQRCHSTRLERVGIVVGWRKGDAASLMAQSTGGQAIALLAVYLQNIGAKSPGDILYSVSRGLLPLSACSSSPQMLERVAQVLADKLAVIAFGTIFAEQVCRIHKAYQHLQQRVPTRLLEPLNEDWLSEVLVMLSLALREDKRMIRIRGSCGIGYILSLVVTLFANDCLVAIEGVVIHQGHRSSSIVVEITSTLEEQPLEVHSMRKVDSITELLHSSRLPRDHLYFICDPLPTKADFAWNGLVSDLLHNIFQRWDLMCSQDVIQSVGLCALSAADVTYMENFPVKHLLGEHHNNIIHKRCEVVLRTQLPKTWPSYPESFKRLDEAMTPSIMASPENALFQWTSPDEDPFGFKGQIMDAIWLTFVTLFVKGHEDATWRHFDFGDEGISTRPSDWGDPTQPFFDVLSNSVWRQLFPRAWGTVTSTIRTFKALLVDNAVRGVVPFRSFISDIGEI
ncbi:hypothetical protein ATEIFO6365_0007047200 [Aspergillus terreus]|uniref:Uncharacterized protein n=1 Tax=Aspergillus terreus TaxID=33178 RepID=A0A5M3Z5B8_ASPTE|nr:hypothetical protein ATETN484_0009047200 [Aspergillus terreus]GFF17923.1 hypothetical protein ATEIFO6365_0007047200 [Aspergillus terreus]